jgi:poly-gamma-glutamate synthesis protein (capsule biosynthesis protein)
MSLASSAGAIRAPSSRSLRGPSARALALSVLLVTAPLGGVLLARASTPRPRHVALAPRALPPRVVAPVFVPLPPAPIAPRAQTITVQAAGDYLLHTRVQDSATFHGGYAYLTSQLAPLLARGDVNVVNLETPLAEQRNPEGASPPVLNGPAEAALALRACGFDAAILANNHAYDQTARGVAETRAAVESASLVAVGGGRNAEEARAARTMITEGGVRVALLAFTQTINATTLVGRLGPDDPQVALWRGEDDLALVRQAAATHDVVIVAMHWGDELSVTPNHFQETVGRALCAAGANVVAGSHPHVLQPVVRDGDCVVAYSLGNLLSNQGLKYKRGGLEPVEAGSAEARGDTRDGALLRVVLSRGDDERMHVASVGAVPLFTHNNWLERFGDPAFQNDIFVAPLAGLLGDAARARHHALYAERMETVSFALGPRAPLLDE